jgi:serine/threonine protein kinase
MVEADRLETINEIQMLQKINKKSPYIVEYFGDFKFSLFQCIIIEYCPNGDLQDSIEKFKFKGHEFSSNQILEWALDITRGLVILHENGIIHWDIKPGYISFLYKPIYKKTTCKSSCFYFNKNPPSRNIFMMESRMNGRRLKIGDLGFSKAVNSLTSSCYPGTANYMSPEIIKQDRDYTNKIDVWALGCVLYELITLQKLFDGTNEFDIKMKIMSGELNFSSDIDPGHRRILNG